ncbi:MAG: FKBP-type peptidyl-prolyl cis-trans isomerase [Bacteroidales bacterium]|nr:FKBP-type peptidyl-prolyl cis-trans isomerase [Bacteroidales bacterium]
MDKISYSLGVSVGMNLKEQGFELESLNDFSKGLESALKGADLEMDLDTINNIIRDYFNEMQQKRHAEILEMQNQFFAENAKKEGVITLESGLQYEIIAEGAGEKATIDSTVTTHYHGTLLDGKVFDSSVQRNEPASFPVNGVILAWQEALQLMPVGSKWKLYVPSELAYGAQGAGNMIGPHTPLIFEVELISIN